MLDGATIAVGGTVGTIVPVTAGVGNGSGGLDDGTMIGGALSTGGSIGSLFSCFFHQKKYTEVPIPINASNTNNKMSEHTIRRFLFLSGCTVGVIGSSSKDLKPTFRNG
jgi:hypothetical protein